MKSKRQWKPGDRLDSIMNVLLIVLALGVLGVGAMELEVGTTAAAHQAASEQRP